MKKAENEGHSISCKMRTNNGCVKICAQYQHHTALILLFTYAMERVKMTKGVLSHLQNTVSTLFCGLMLSPTISRNDLQHRKSMTPSVDRCNAVNKRTHP